MIRTLASLLCASTLAVGASSAFAMDHADNGKMERGNLWEMVDTDNDGKISQEEYRTQSQKWFEKMDKNSDGTIDKEERAAFKQNMREAHKDAKHRQMGDKMQHKMDGQRGDMHEMDGQHDGMRGMDDGVTAE